MLSRKSLVKMKSWKKLESHYKRFKDIEMKDLFEKDETRAKNYTINFNNLVFDYSKNRIDKKTLNKLFDLARECDLENKISSMFVGDKINTTENRSVLHTALRNFSDKPVYSSGVDVMPQIKEVLKKMKDFSESVRLGTFLGQTGKKLTTIVNIGIGGSDLGPNMASEALRKYWQKGMSCHFISNIDGTACAEVLNKIDPETTLFIIASKTFTTIETLTNARTCRKWLVDALGEHAVSKHFVALSTNTKEVEKFGIDTQNMFEFWDFVGGRYSIWSAISLSLVILIGMDKFEQMLEGAHDVDNHFRESPLEENIPVIMALIGIWYNNFFGFKRYSVIAYDHYLRFLPYYLQQLDMESNGKSVTMASENVSYSTAPVIFGGAGTDVQHSFFQMIHQGTDLVPVDFIIPAISQNEIGEHHEILLSNVLAQAEALMSGKTEKEVVADLKEKGMKKKDIDALKKFKVFSGNRPSNMFLFRKIDAYSLGMLIALYEHKVYTQGVIWDINSFDQWGVELGKELALKIFPEIKGELYPTHDGSTKDLIMAIKRFRGL